MNSDQKFRRLTSAPFICASILALSLLFLLTGTVGFSAAASQYAVLDNYTGGDCSQIGSWDQYSKTCTLLVDLTSGLSINSDNVTIDGNGHSLTGTGAYGVYAESINGGTIKNLTIDGFSYGVFLAWSNHMDIRWNNISGSSSEGVGIWASSFNDVVGNNISGSSEDGIGLAFYCEGNTIRGNTISGNYWGFWIAGSGPGNFVYNNNFLGNAVQADGFGEPLTLDIAAPIGGNHWGDRVSPDAEGDGFVDDPVITAIGQDNLPWVTASGWCGRPDLRLTQGRTYWGSYADYSSGMLSVDYDVSNAGFRAVEAELVGSQPTNGVILGNSLPQPVGEIAPGGHFLFMFKYHVPPGVVSFNVVTYAVARDLCGATYTYPGPYQG